MPVYHFPDNFHFDLPVCITIGNFDGVHKGHLHLIEKTKNIAQKFNLEPLLITFSPHPALVLKNGAFPGLLTSREEKLRLIQNAGLENILEIPFTEEFSRLSPALFLERWLLPLNVFHIVTGHDFCFGSNKSGSYETLIQMGRKAGFTVSRENAVRENEKDISSSLLRKLLHAGEIPSVSKMLGRFYHVSGTVAHGFGRGVKIGFPTANLENIGTILPGNGVYATLIKHGSTVYQAVTNIGSNPTFNGNRTTVESFILDADINLYGESITVYFIERIRSEIRFPSPAELSAQISSDVKKAKEILSSVHAAT